MWLEFVFIVQCCRLILQAYTTADFNVLKEDEHLLSERYTNEAKSTAHYFSNQWVVKVDGNLVTATQIALDRGFDYGYEVNILGEKFHVFIKENHPEMHYVESDHHTAELIEHNNVTWAQQLFGRTLHRRDNFEVYRRSITRISRYEREFNDELWSLQWYEQDYRENSTVPALDMNLVPVYKEFNITGDGIRVCIIDDGIEYLHEDLKDNFDPSISINLNRGTYDITPRYEDARNCHGTRCAGEIAMKANNTKCGVGVAFNSKIGGITLLDGVTNDLLEAIALTYATHLVDIYSGSWGPLDNGKACDGPGPLASLALKLGALSGRQGRGALYVFAAGNGGILNDNCSADGYVNSIYSIAVASATQTGDLPAYSEKCPAVIATSYSGSLTDGVKIVTTDINNSCTVKHSGTSAAAPLVAGILALVLEANPNLTWRDAQHIIIHTADASALRQNIEWIENGFGLRFSNHFGFGLVNAYKMVSVAFSWKNVPPKYICSILFDLNSVGNNQFSSESDFYSTLFTDGCGRRIRYLEHVELNTSLSYPIRGHIEIELTSPHGTKCKMLQRRINDNSSKGFDSWTFLSLLFWGENPLGHWTVHIYDSAVKRRFLNGNVTHLELIIHGTQDAPDHYRLNNPRDLI